MSLDLTEFEFSVDLTCEVVHAEPRRAIRYKVLGCFRCRHLSQAVAVCGDCYVAALRARSALTAQHHLIICAGCNQTLLPLQFIQFYDPKNLGLRVSP